MTNWMMKKMKKEIRAWSNKPNEKLNIQVMKTKQDTEKCTESNMQ